MTFKSAESTMPGSLMDAIEATLKKKMNEPIIPKEIPQGGGSSSTKAGSITDTIFHQSGTIFSVQPKGNSGTNHDLLPPGNYVVKRSLMGYYLEAISDFPPMKKIYGETPQTAARILNTYRSKNGNLGVLLEGLKGSGKTLLARLVSIEGAKLGIPTLTINSAHTGEDFFQFLYSIQQECIVFFDEFEKVYDAEDQESLLTVLDGSFPSKKLFLLTSNDSNKIDAHMKNRPGRIHYYLVFKGLSGAFVKEYVADNLENKEHEKELLSICGIFTNLNFDSLHTLVWEMNLYKEPAGQAITMLNTKPEANGAEYYALQILIKGNPRVFAGDFLERSTERLNPMTFESFNPLVKVPALPELAMEIFGISKDEVLDLNPRGFEETERLVREAKERGEGKISWRDHDYSSSSMTYQGRYFVTLRIQDEVPGGKYDFNFSCKDIKGIDIDTGVYTYVNAAGNTLRLVRQAAKEFRAGDILSYMD